METKLDIQKLYFDLKRKKVKIKNFDSGLVSLGIQTETKEETSNKKAQPKKAELIKEKLAE